MALNIVSKSVLRSARFVNKTVPVLQRCTKNLSNEVPALNKKEVEITFIRHDGAVLKTKGKVGQSLLDVVVKYDVDLEGYGACEGTLTCSTCHVILSQEDFDKLPDKPGGEEGDMLELAKDVSKTSRLGCQVIVQEWMDGMVVNVPECPNDLREL